MLALVQGLALVVAVDAVVAHTLVREAAILVVKNLATVLVEEYVHQLAPVAVQDAVLVVPLAVKNLAIQVVVQNVMQVVH